MFSSNQRLNSCGYPEEPLTQRETAGLLEGQRYCHYFQQMWRSILKQLSSNTIKINMPLIESVNLNASNNMLSTSWFGPRTDGGPSLHSLSSVYLWIATTSTEMLWEDMLTCKGLAQTTEPWKEIPTSYCSRSGRLWPKFSNKNWLINTGNRFLRCHLCDKCTIYACEKCKALMYIECFKTYCEKSKREGNRECKGLKVPKDKEC